MAWDSPAGGDARVISGMMNGYIDIPFSLLGFKPNVGAGLGAARVDLSHVTAAGAPLLDGRQTVMAFQDMAGLGYALASHVMLTIASSRPTASNRTRRAARPPFRSNRTGCAGSRPNSGCV